MIGTVKPFSLNLSLDFEAPKQGVLKFSFNSYSSSLLKANNKVFKALKDLFEAVEFNVRRSVLLDMVHVHPAHIDKKHSHTHTQSTDVPTQETMDELLENEEEDEEPVLYTEDDAKFAEDILNCKKKGDLHGIFTLIEADGDGDLSSRDLKRAVERVLNLQLTDQEAQDMFADADWDSGGSISETEWYL